MINPVYPAEKWVPSINKAVLRACPLYAANSSGIFLGGVEMVSARGGRSCEHFGGYKTINRIPLTHSCLKILSKMKRTWIGRHRPITIGLSTKPLIDT